MRQIGLVLVMFVGVAAMWMPTGGRLIAAEGHRMTLHDDCDPNDPAWAPQGCANPHGDVTRAEFNAFLVSPLSAAVIGHPSWRFNPGYLSLENGNNIEVRNAGGRTHTFTEVANYGGGFVPPLNIGLFPAPECLNPAATGPTTVAPGSNLALHNVAPGIHKFQCCIHPWMRAAIRVQ